MKQPAKINFWLLLAATAAVDAVAIAWLVQAGTTSRAAFLFDALLTGQLAVVSIWAVFAARRMWSSLLAIALAVIASTVLEAWGAWLSADEATESFGLYACLAGAIVAALWILKQTPLWRGRPDVPESGWQFSVGQVLVVMTLVAIVLAVLRRAELFQSDIWRLLIALTICDVLIVVAAVVARIVLRHWTTRLAADCAVAGLLGVLHTAAGASGLLGENVIVAFSRDVVPMMAYTIVISLVVFAWLELAPILPLARRAELSPPAASVGD